MGTETARGSNKDDSHGTPHLEFELEVSQTFSTRFPEIVRAEALKNSLFFEEIWSLRPPHL